MKDASRYVLAYLLWAVSIVLSAFIGLVARDVLFNGLVVSMAGNAGQSKSADFYLGLQLRGVEPWSYVILGIAVVIVVVVLEHYYLEGARKKLILPRFLKVTGIEIAVLAVVHMIRFSIGVVLGNTSWMLIMTVVIELAVFGLLVWLYQRVFRQQVAAN